jgi:hypothetical protein
MVKAAGEFVKPRVGKQVCVNLAQLERKRARVQAENFGWKTAMVVDDPFLSRPPCIILDILLPNWVLERHGVCS